jgi:hypothetical protein
MRGDERPKVDVDRGRLPESVRGCEDEEEEVVLWLFVRENELEAVFILIEW